MHRDDSAFRALDVERVTANRRFHGYERIIALADTASTNADAREHLGEASWGGTTIVADYQSAGTGRKGRPWIAPPGSSLLFTAILRRTLTPSALWVLPFWTALAVAGAVEAVTGTRLDLHWPNDLFLSDRKCAGILCITRVAGEVVYAGCGVGIDVTRPRDDAVLAAIEPPPAFLSDAVPVEREALLAAILDRFAATEHTLDDPQAIADTWAARADLTRSRYRVRFDADGSVREGLGRRLGPSGELILDEAGRETVVALADARVIAREGA